MPLIGAGLCDDIDDAALGLAKLRLEAAGLYLDLFYERGVNSDAQRAIRAGEDAKPAEGRVGDVDAVGDVQIIKRRPAGNGWVGASASKAVRRSRAKVKQAGYAARKREALVKMVAQVRADSSA